MKNLKNFVYILTCMSFTIVIGAATYEHLALWPQAFAAPPSSLTVFQGDYQLAPVNFWRLIHPVTVALFVLAGALHWKTPRRRSLLVTFVGYLAVIAITALYFVPELVAIAGTEMAATVDLELVARGETWQYLSWLRQAVIMGLAVYLYWGLTRSPEPTTAS